MTEVILTKDEIDEISLIVSHAFSDINEGVFCRLDNHKYCWANNNKERGDR